MFISIIIPVYNVETYLVECLDSVFAQDINNCEIIIVNDGSTDGSRAIISQYKAVFPDLIIIDQINLGLSEARNTGMKIAKGEYLYFLDSDDYLLKNAVKIIIDAIKDSNSEVFVFNATVNANKILIPSSNVVNSSKNGIEFFENFYKDNGSYPAVNIWLYVYKRSFIEKNNLFFYRGLYHEDILFSMQIFYTAKEIRMYNIPIVNYRQFREGSISTDVKLKNIVDKAVICRILDEYFEMNNFFNRYFYNNLFDIYLILIKESLYNGFLKESHNYFSAKDKKIMRKGVLSRYEYKLWVLSLISTRIMISYHEQSIPSVFRRSINISFSIFFKLHRLKTLYC